jgi:hypothetical protein
MSTLASKAKPLAKTVSFSNDEMTVSLVDGRSITVPLNWFPKLAGAAADELVNWELLGDGQGIHWPTLDEDLSVAGLLEGWSGRK